MINTDSMPQVTSSDNWLMSIHGFEEMVYSVQAFSLPGISLGSTPMPSKSNIIPNITGDKLQFDPLSVTALHDRRFLGYLSVFNWMTTNSKSDFPVLRDIIITAFDPLHPEERLRIKFFDAFPIAINGPDYDAQGDIPTQTVSYTFVYDYFVIEPEIS